jgi:2-keto-4-pentenoate hydratase/2-oxohepta-3-ene-1,7-dioic acid hydratase in catechol pathway
MKLIRFLYSQKTYYGDMDNGQVVMWSNAPWLGGHRTANTILFEDVKLLAPCQPRKIIATAINYPGATGLKKEANEPLFFIKPSSSVIGPDQPIISPFRDVPLWGECELGVVIGKKLQRANAKEVEDGILGYTIGNDVSAENILGWDHHLARSKCADTFCPLGPWIDTSFNPQGKMISGYHNSELIRKGYLSERLWKEPDLLVWLSSWMTLEPGDVILTGAPTRVRERIYFKNGDHFTCRIEGLGELSNPFQGLHD